MPDYRLNKGNKLITLLLMLSITLPSLAQKLPSEDAGKIDVLKLEGESFQGRIRATGLIGLFSVKGVLSFKNGMLTWSTKDSKNSATYITDEVDGVLVFTSHVPGEDGIYVKWRGIYDGKSVSDVKATWTRTEEDDFIHDLFLPDVVTLVFKQKKD